MSAFAGKQTFRTIKSNVRYILKADVQTEEIIGNKVANSTSQIDFAE